MELVLVRHAFAGSNRDGIASCAVPGDGLTSEGVEQARRLATRSRTRRSRWASRRSFARTQETLELALAGRDVRASSSPSSTRSGSARSRRPARRVPRVGGRAAAGRPRPAAARAARTAAARFARGLRIVLARPEEACSSSGTRWASGTCSMRRSGLAPARAHQAPVEHATPHRWTLALSRPPRRCSSAGAAPRRFRSALEAAQWAHGRDVAERVDRDVRRHDLDPARRERRRASSREARTPRVSGTCSAASATTSPPST